MNFGWIQGALQALGVRYRKMVGETLLREKEVNINV